jgi:hypothetical protein
MEKNKTETKRKYFKILIEIYLESAESGFVDVPNLKKEHGSTIIKRMLVFLRKEGIVSDVGAVNHSKIIWIGQMPTLSMAKSIQDDINNATRLYNAGLKNISVKNDSVSSYEIDILQKKVTSTKVDAVKKEKINSKDNLGSATILYQISPNELIEMISEVVKVQIEALVSKIENPEKIEFMSRQEAADFLKVSLFTIHLWMNKGILKPLKMGNRTYFERKEIVDYLFNSNSK